MVEEYVKEYIEREAAKERLRIWITNFRDCIDLLDSIPAADVVPVLERT